MRPFMLVVAGVVVRLRVVNEEVRLVRGGGTVGGSRGKKPPGKIFAKIESKIEWKDTGKIPKGKKRFFFPAWWEGAS
jgi:hypothetical protein